MSTRPETLAREGSTCAHVAINVYGNVLICERPKNHAGWHAQGRIGWPAKELAVHVGRWAGEQR